MSCKQINLKITNQDWSSLKNKIHQVKTFCIEHPERGVWHDIVGGYRFDFGTFGSFMEFNLVTETPYAAGCMTGPMVESLIPWTKQLRKDLQGLTVSSLGFQYNTEGLQRHCDRRHDPAIKNHCKVNYMISDENYSTFVDTGTEILSHPTKKDTAWLLDTTLPHWVEGQGNRYIFQISFYDSYDTVYQHLEKLNLVY